MAARNSREKCPGDISAWRAMAGTSSGRAYSRVDQIRAAQMREGGKALLVHGARLHRGLDTQSLDIMYIIGQLAERGGRGVDPQVHDPDFGR